MQVKGYGLQSERTRGSQPAPCILPLATSYARRDCGRVGLRALRVFAALWVASCPAARAQTSVSLAWDPSPDTNVVGYALYCGNVSGGPYTIRQDVRTNMAGMVTPLTEGLPYYFVAVAYDAQGVESPPSNEVNFHPLAGANQLWGRVLWAGQPVAGAQVKATNAGAIFQTTTDTNGAYILAGLGSTNTYTVSCAATGLTFTAQFSNPVSLASGNVYGVDFFANQPLPGGGTALVISPYQVQAAGGQTVSFRADAWDQFGNPVAISPTWSVGGGGTIGSSGSFTATTMGGPYIVTATASGLTATGSVWVTSQVRPPNLSIKALGGGIYSILGGGVAGGAYRLQFSDTPVTNWHTLGSATADAFGVFGLRDTNGSPHRYYRSVYP